MLWDLVFQFFHVVVDVLLYLFCGWKVGGVFGVVTLLWTFVSSTRLWSIIFFRCWCGGVFVVSHNGRTLTLSFTLSFWCFSNRNYLTSVDCYF
ncbi:hypothetical protein VIGAN_09081200, partial [Vigna angularis var. angularis]